MRFLFSLSPLVSRTEGNNPALPVSLSVDHADMSSDPFLPTPAAAAACLHGHEKSSQPLKTRTRTAAIVPKIHKHLLRKFNKGERESSNNAPESRKTKKNSDPVKRCPLPKLPSETLFATPEKMKGEQEYSIMRTLFPTEDTLPCPSPSPLCIQMLVRRVGEDIRPFPSLILSRLLPI